MEWWQIALIVMAVAFLAAIVAAFVLWRRASGRTKQLAGRIAALPWRLRFVLMRRLLADRRLPLRVRLIPPLLVLYLAMPLDLIPDFIPVLGQLDDLAVAVVAIALFSRYAPLRVIEEHLQQLEARHGEAPGTEPQEQACDH